MRAAAEILVREAEALPVVLGAAAPEDFDLPTVCTGWSVRDVLAHCAAALTDAVAGKPRGYGPVDNQHDVDRRRRRPVAQVVEELIAAYPAAARAIDAAGGGLDGVGLGEWVHGGDVRDALGCADAYTSAGLDLAIPLLVARSETRRRPALLVTVDGERLRFGVDDDPVGLVSTDAETFVRLCGGRRPDPGRYRLEGCGEADLLLFS